MRAGVRTFIYISVIAMLWAGHALAQDQQFFETLYDVPVMEGLEEVPEMALSFDKPNGRIAEAGAVSDRVSPQEVGDFYTKSLVQMGWALAPAENTPLRYIREGEVLLISVDKSIGSLVVRYRLSPYSAAKP